ncbi:MAG: hypothetical protein V1793_04650 [Pseudomonadota bacterium]
MRFGFRLTDRSARGQSQPRVPWLTQSMVSQTGSLLISMVVMLMVVSVFAVITLSLVSTNQMQAATGSLDLKAYYAAESGMRYAAARYLHQGTSADPNDTNADNEKADVLKTGLDGKTFSMPGGGGSFSYEVYPYWFSVVERNGMFQLELPGRKQTGFSMPGKGTLYTGDTVGNPMPVPYTGGQLTEDGVFTCNELTSANLANKVGKSFYLSLSPGSNGYRDFIPLHCTEPGMFPRTGGRIEFTRSGITYLAYYAYAAFDAATDTLTLYDLKDCVTGNSLTLYTDTTTAVVLKKFITLRIIGRAGLGDSGYTQSIDYSIAIGDSVEEQPMDQLAPIKFTVESPDPPPMFTPPDKDPDILEPSLSIVMVNPVLEFIPDTNGKRTQNIYAMVMRYLLEREDPGETNVYCHGSAPYNDTDLIQTRWQESGHRLGYDVQLKFMSNWGNYATFGLEFRKQFAATSPDGIALYKGYGLSFMKYYSPSIVFDSGSREIKAGDWIYYYGTADQENGIWDCNGSSIYAMAKAQVERVIPLGGSWETGTAAGRLLLKGHTLEMLMDPDCPCVPETFFRASTQEQTETIWDVDGNVLAAAAVVDIAHGGYNDHIPDSLKPPGMGSWFHGNVNYSFRNEITAMDKLEGAETDEEPRLLLVLWQQRVVGNEYEERRWLACKDVTHDPKIVGNQNIYDGRIVRDNTGLLLRIREKGSGPDKVNEIHIFYSDGEGSPEGRAKTPFCGDYNANRMGYQGGWFTSDGYFETDRGVPLWPPQDLSLWDICYPKIDYFTHLEKSEQDPVHWDLLATETGTISSWDKGGQAVFRVKDDGTVILSDLTTPDTGTYKVNEIALSSHFDATRWYSVVSASALEPVESCFYDFAIQFARPGKFKGGFLNAIQN